jgi:diaminohydroxyphosphoribosylaminopyrimidine deaminase/5-amino-6-(5-phosphoribosylamino)uracil reductase
MRRALTLAAETTALASPNPQVGCVLVRNSEIFSEGAHRYDHLDHAEIVALKQAAAKGISTEGATAYVTLEPCSHQGRTGPCADALIAARVARVVIATQDPNPKVSGQGIARLRAAGVSVTVGILQSEARTLNDPFAHFIRTGKPFVTLKSALSIDGKLAPNPLLRTPNQPHWLTGEAARADVQTLRHASDAILTGIGTILADNPTLTDRTNLPRRRPLLRIILDPQLRIPLTASILGPNLLILHAESANPTKAQALQNAGAELLPLDTHKLRTILDHLSQRQILSLLVESGPTLTTSFLTQNLVDRLILYYADTELGPESLLFTPNPILLQQRLLRPTRVTFPNGQTEDVRITGYLHDPWKDVPQDVT